jgi:hypothetical protein
MRDGVSVVTAADTAYFEADSLDETAKFGKACIPHVARREPIPSLASARTYQKVRRSVPTKVPTKKSGALPIITKPRPSTDLDMS